MQRGGTIAARPRRAEDGGEEAVDHSPVSRSKLPNLCVGLSSWKAIGAELPCAPSEENDVAHRAARRPPPALPRTRCATPRGKVMKRQWAQC